MRLDYDDVRKQGGKIVTGHNTVAIDVEREGRLLAEAFSYNSRVIDGANRAAQAFRRRCHTVDVDAVNGADELFVAFI